MEQTRVDTGARRSDGEREGQAPEAESASPGRSGVGDASASAAPRFSRALMEAAKAMVPDMRRGSTLFAMSLAASFLALAVWTSRELVAAPDEPYAATRQFAAQAVSEY